MDVGIASEDNRNLVRENDFSYIVVLRSHPEQMEEGTLHITC